MHTTIRFHRGALSLALAMAALCAPGVASSALAAPPSRAPSANDAASAPAGVVNLNTATVEQLDALPGIGPSKAKAIVAHREKQPFERVQDILHVKGIGRGTFRKLRPMLAVTGETTLVAAKASKTKAKPGKAKPGKAKAKASAAKR